MVVPITNIVEQGFDPQDTKDLNLSLLIGPDRLSYLVMAPDNKEILALSAYSLENNEGPTSLLKDLEVLFKSDHLLSQKFKRSYISLYTKRFTLIPNELYEDSQTELYFQTAMHLDKTDHLQTDTVASIQSTIIYSINNELNALLLDYFPNALRNCTAKPIIDLALKKSGQEEYIVLALLQARSICLTVLHKGNLILHQIYGFQNAEDCLYFILLAYKSLGLSTEKIPLSLSGELIQDSEIYKLLYQYIRNISFVNRPKGLTYGAAIQKLPAQFHFDLFSIAISNI